MEAIEISTATVDVVDVPNRGLSCRMVRTSARLRSNPSQRGKRTKGAGPPSREAFLPSWPRLLPGQRRSRSRSVGLSWSFFFLTKKNRIPKEREREREKRPVAGFEGVDGDWTAVTSSLTCKQAPRQTQAPAPPASPKQLVEQRSFQVRNSVKLGKTR